MNNNYFYPFDNSIIDNINYDNNNLYGPYEGYLKGNLFNNLYEEYKDYRPASFRFKNEKEEALFNLNQISFAMHELNLYLDIYPNDSNYINKYCELEKTYNSLLTSYEKKYGPINVNGISNTTPFSWVTNSFPWEVK